MAWGPLLRGLRTEGRNIFDTGLLSPCGRALRTALCHSEVLFIVGPAARFRGPLYKRDVLSKLAMT